MRIIRSVLVPVAIVLLLVSFAPPQAIRSISMKVTSRTLSNGRSLTSSGSMGYNASGGTMVTHIVSPVENWLFLNSKGELKIYDPMKKSVLVEPNSGATSQANYMYYFLSGQTGDMGLRAMGFNVSDTRFENGMVVTTWMPPSVMAGLLGKVELVHENYRPIYVGWYDLQGSMMLKTYYSNYLLAGGLNFPQAVTEIRFKSATDSTIEKKIYTDIRVNESSDMELFNFRIPKDAKITTH